MSAVRPVAFVDSTYQEALRLTEEARDYFTSMDGEARSVGLEPRDILLQSCEALRVTSRLTQAMAWLLIQKAVQSGEISREEAAKPEHRLSGEDVCAYEGLAFEGRVLPKLADLLDRSLKLYQRVARLDSQYGGS